MTWAYHIALGNALAILPLAAVVWLVTRWVRSPALCRSLWILLLVKLVSLPLLPVSIPKALGTAANYILPDHARAPVTDIAEPAELEIPAGAESGFLRSSWNELVRDVVLVEQSAVEGAVWAGHLGWLTLVTAQRPIILLWGLGSLLCVLSCLRHTRTFAKSLESRSRADVALDAEVRSLASQIRLLRLPRVLLADLQMSPLLFGVGRWTVLYFPASLWAELEKEERRTLLLHELVHYQRRDHWVRLFESICLALYWWHPVAWWVRQRIEETEEEACDETVIRHMDGRVYARAILAAVDYLAESPRRPALACGLGRFPWMKYRLQRILGHRSACEPCRIVRRAILALGLAVLPLQPIFLPPGGSPEALEIFEVFEDSQYLLAGSQG